MAKKEKAAPQKPPVGKTSGVSVSRTWVQVFERNATIDEEERLTDEQLVEFMQQEFPDVAPESFKRVDIARSKYNRGGFNKDKKGNPVRPKIHSEPHEPLGGSSAGKTQTAGEGGVTQGATVQKFQKNFKAHKK